MELTSTIIGQTANSKISQLDLDAIFAAGYGGRLSSLVIVSAYTDVKYIEEIIKRFNKKTYKKINGCHFSIYLDEKASRYNTDEDTRKSLDKCAKRIEKNKYFNDKSGIFLVSCGSLFHSKFIISKSNTYSRFIIGSINFTKKAFTKNEEIALTLQAKKNSKSNIDLSVKKLIKNAEDYISLLNPQKISKNTTFIHRPTYPRELFLDGSLYREFKEQDPFRIQLNLPEDYLAELEDKEKTSDTHSIYLNNEELSFEECLSCLDGKKSNSLSLPKIIELAKLDMPEYFKTNIQSQKKLFNNRYTWKNYCIETSLGYWVPTPYKRYVEKILNTKRNKKQSKLNALGYYIKDNGNNDKLKKTFRNIIFSFQKALAVFVNQKQHNPKSNDWQWKNFSESEIDDLWDKWKNKIIEKITSNDYEKYRERLLCGVAHFCVPDLWDDPISSKEFEDSVCDSIRYNLSIKEKNFKKLCAGVNNELAKNKQKYDIDNNNDILKMLSSFVDFLSFKNKVLDEYAKKFNEEFDDLDDFLSSYKYFEKNYEVLKYESEEKRITKMKQFLNKNDFYD